MKFWWRDNHVPRTSIVHHLQGAASEAEGQGPEGAFTPPVKDVVGAGDHPLHSWLQIITGDMNVVSLKLGHTLNKRARVDFLKPKSCYIHRYIHGHYARIPKRWFDICAYATRWRDIGCPSVPNWLPRRTASHCIRGLPRNSVRFESPT